MNQTPLVSILMPAYNSGSWIAETIQSALAQTWPAIEIIIVDDGSTDNTLTIARQFESEKIKVFSQANKGASAARNKAFTESSGQYIQYLDADDLMAPNKISLQMDVLLRQPEFTLTSCRWGIFNDAASKTKFAPTVLWKDFDDPINWLITAWSYNKWMPNLAWLTSREIIEKAGPWNEALSLHDDGEFFSRVLLAGKSIKFVSEAEVYYRKGLTGSLSQQRSLKAEKSRLRVYELYENHLLNAKDSAETRSACADNYQKFIYRVYPRFPELQAVAEDHLKRLGGSNMKLKRSRLFNMLSAVFGWKKAVKVENMLQEKGLMPHQLKKKILK